MTAQRVSVIILNWNGLSMLQRCLSSVANTDYPNLEIILADNASTDSSIEWVRTNFPEIKIVRHDENGGYCRGNNLAFEHASGELVVFLNNDVETPEDWLKPLVKRMVDEPYLAAIQPKLRDFTNRDQFEYAGAAGGFLDRYGYPFARGRVFSHIEMDKGQYDAARYAFWATGSALMVRASLFSEVGGFDENFFMHMEEIDLCWRFQRAGYRIGVEPASAVYHMGGASLPKGNPRKDFYNFRNSLLLLYKNLPPRVFARVIPIRLFLDALAFCRAFVFGPRSALSIIRAHAAGHRMKRLYSQDRPSSQASPLLPPYRKSIARSFYFLRKKRFSELEHELHMPPLPSGGTHAD